MAGTPSKDGPDKPLATTSSRLDGGVPRQPDGTRARPASGGGRGPAGRTGAGSPTSRRPVRRRRAPVLVAAAVTTGWAAVVSYLSVVAVLGLVVLVGGGASAPVVFRFGTAGWLLAHGVPLGTSAGPLGLVPLAVSGLAAWRVARAGVHTARAIGARQRGPLRLAIVAATMVGLVYGVIGVVAAAAAHNDALAISPIRAGFTCGVFALLTALAGAVVESRIAAGWWDRLPLVARDAVRTGVVAALLVLGAGAAVAGVAVAVAGGEASSMFAAYRTGVAGQAGLTLLCLVFAPNLAVWSMSYLVGPGFVVGAGATVSAAKVSLGALPAIPVLAGLPSTAVSGLAAPLLGVPMAGGMAAGWLLARRRLRQAEQGTPEPTWSALLGAAALAGPAAGILLGLVAWASGGSLGSGRLAQTGPTGWTVGLVGALVVAVGAVIAAAATRVLAGGRRSGRYR
ncbi:cell division protein PerM [Rugosimonospora africana]|uniref:Uncharacterized protein n=1 Tax=Rugosimonospora africana TaxID=556532 RepID=A0A8J3QK90_9ACTN|nr:DUF6350 family protein [Rugosimonospora africana]GIH12136.1 hypothetical protein Raf01_03080 [Rugosimonospora africana]